MCMLSRACHPRLELQRGCSRQHLRSPSQHCPRNILRSKQPRPDQQQLCSRPQRAADQPWVVTVCADARADASGSGAPAAVPAAEAQHSSSALTASPPERSEAVVREDVDLSVGTLHIGPMHLDEVAALSVLVTRAFAGTPEAFSFKEIRKYVEELSQDPRESLVLVGRLEPSDSSIFVPEGKKHRLAGAVMLSFVDATREAFPSLQPPPQHAYLSNTAVDSALHRRGIARALLGTAEKACHAAGHSAVTLHARLADDAALQLYRGQGFKEVARDPAGWSFARRYRPRALMMKELQ